MGEPPSTPELALLARQRFVVGELSNWYIRRNRRRFWKGETGADKLAAYATLFDALSGKGFEVIGLFGQIIEKAAPCLIGEGQKNDWLGDFALHQVV